MKISKEKFHEELINEYEEAHITLCQIQGAFELLHDYMIEYKRITNEITGPKSNGALRLLIGKMFDNYYTGYVLDISLFKDNEYVQSIKDQYLGNPEDYIDYDILSESPCELKDYNPYKDLIKLENYLSILISQSENIEEELINLYNNVCEYNKLSIFEKREELSTFFNKNYNFDFEFNKANNLISQLYLDYKTYYDYEETYYELMNPMIKSINKYEDNCKKLIKHHERLYFEILNLLNEIKSSTENKITLDEIIKFKKVIDNELIPVTREYFIKCIEINEENEEEIDN